MSEYIVEPAPFNHQFEVVDKVPSDYMVWNIPPIEGFENYIPFCQWKYPDNNQNYDVNLFTLKAIRVLDSEVEKLRWGSHHGCDNLASAKSMTKGRGLTASFKKTAAELVQIFAKYTEN